MTGKSRLLAALTAGVFPTHAVQAAELAPHRASYELSLADEATELLGVDGRIAMELSLPECETYELDYRFVARFQQENELILTDQQTVTKEAVSGDRYEFETKTFIDGAGEKVISGVARDEAGQTVVQYDEPEPRTIELPRSTFPMQHTRALIDKAKAGERIVESRLFDGDEEAEKLLTSTAIIAPVEEAELEASLPAGPKGLDARESLSGLSAWRISESFYNSDSDADGMAIFETAYTLYENGVAGDLLLRFDGYTLTGELATLELLDRPDCG